MPNRTIYVSEDDMPLFQLAQKLSGDNVSSAIVQALRRFVDVEQQRRHGYDQVVVRVGDAGSRTKKRFLGVRIARWRHQTSTGKRVEIFDVYRTAKGHLAVHKRVSPNWVFWSDPESWRDPANWSAGWDAEEAGSSSLEVFGSSDELKGHVPDELHAAVLHSFDEVPLEDLDI